jgi:hypothetical protein
MDLISIIEALHDIIFGASGTTTTTTALKIHDSVASLAQSAPFYLINFFAKYAVFAFLFSIAMVIIIVLYARRYEIVRNKVMAKILPTDGSVESNVGEAEIENPKWKLVLDHSNSDDANKWKLAILEADIILAELLDTLNLPGDGVGEKLKAVDPSDFTTIEKAWEGHKIRNAIAHEGSDFLINQREAKRVIGLYQKVFEEFEII